MGVDYSSQAFIGVEIPNPNIIERIRLCDHPEQKAKFCPECGRPMWKDEERLHPILDKMQDDYDGKGPLTYISSGMFEGVYVGYKFADSGSNRSGGRCASKIELSDDLSIPEIKKKMKKVLGDLYNERNFGLWSVLDAG